jgi:hypothetical protein
MESVAAVETAQPLAPDAESALAQVHAAAEAAETEDEPAALEGAEAPAEVESIAVAETERPPPAQPPGG